MILKHREAEKCALCPSTFLCLGFLVIVLVLLILFWFCLFCFIVGVCFCLLVTHVE